MKKIFMMAAAVIISAAPIMAQGIKIDKDAQLKKIARSDADIENEKKNTKANVWLDRGKLFYESGSMISDGLYQGLPVATLEIMRGKATNKGNEVVANQEYATFTYPFVVVYTEGPEVVFWKTTDVIVEDALGKALQAYDKAYQVDPKSQAKVKVAIDQIANEYKKEANNFYFATEYPSAAASFAKAYDAQKHPAVNVIDTLTGYNAGLFYAYAGDFDKARKYLEEVLSYDFDMDGETYYYLYHAYHGQGKDDLAKSILEDGIKKYPGNTSIVGGLIDIYTLTDSDPREIVPLVEKSIADEPDNFALWLGLGGIYNKLGEYHQSMEAYKKATELAPKNPMTFLLYGNSYVELGNKMYDELNTTTFTGQGDYDAALELVIDEYAKSIAPLEHVLTLDPKNGAAIELLKNVAFRVRDREGMMEKYNKYKDMYDELGIE